MVFVLHNTALIGKVTGRYLPNRLDPLRRVRGWSATAQAVGQARQRLLAEGKDVFIIGSHYGITGQLSFYLPEARPGLPAKPLVYYQTSATPKNQFFFWPEYRYRETRKGQNAIFVCDTWKPQVPPPVRLEEFDSVRDLAAGNSSQGTRAATGSVVRVQNPSLTWLQQRDRPASRSATTGDGKTTTITNLAISFAASREQDVDYGCGFANSGYT